VNGYTYIEPGATSISIRGPRLRRVHRDDVAHQRRTGLRRLMRGAWSATPPIRAGARPYLIRPNNTSPNGYELGIGDPSPCSENGDRDWYVEAARSRARM